MTRKSTDITVDPLKIREEIASLLGDILRQFNGVGQRFDHLEDLVRKQRRDTAGLLVMAKAVTSDFAEQLAAVEERVAALEGKGS